jgi:hypothetical protein
VDGEWSSPSSSSSCASVHVFSWRVGASGALAALSVLRLAVGDTQWCCTRCRYCQYQIEKGISCIMCWFACVEGGVSACLAPGALESGVRCQCCASRVVVVIPRGNPWHVHTIKAPIEVSESRACRGCQSRGWYGRECASMVQAERCGLFVATQGWW